MPVIMKDNVQYAYTTKGTVFHTLSNAEYEALSEEEKMNGDVYCIPDREPVINPDQLWEKVGTGTLDIGDDLTDGVNQLNSSKAKYRDISFTLSSSAWRGIYYADIPLPVSINKIISIYVKSIAMNLPCSCYMATSQANSIRVWVPSTAGSDIASQTGTLRVIYSDSDISS